MAESKSNPRGDAPTVTQHRFGEEMTPLGRFAPWNLGSAVAWGVFACLHVCVYMGMKVLQPEQRRQPKMESTWAGILPGLENMSCWAGKALGMCLLPKASSRAGAAFPVPTDAIPSRSPGQLRRRNGNSSRPRECTAGKSIISVIYRLQL